MVETQYRTFVRQSLVSAIIYIPVLVVTAVIINTDQAYAYYATALLDNFEFNLIIGVIIFNGCVSLALSYRVSLIKTLMCSNKDIDGMDDQLDVNHEQPQETNVRYKGLYIIIEIPENLVAVLLYSYIYI